jgi:hypothetical protein
VAGGRPRQAPGRRCSVFSFFFLFLIGLTSGPSVHVSKFIFTLPCQPYSPSSPHGAAWVVEATQPQQPQVDQLEEYKMNLMRGAT